MQTILLLILSNVFMTAAWYGHLKFTDRPLHWKHLIDFTLIVPGTWVIFTKW